MSRFDPWAVLGVPPGSSPQEVRAAWKALAVQYHPDRFATASAEDQRRASAHMTAINVAYDDIRSGRAVPPQYSSAPGPSAGAAAGAAAANGFGGAERASPIWDSPPTDGWFDDEVLAAALRRAEARVRSGRRKSRYKVLGSIAAVAVLALLFHLAMLREYRYDLVYDGRGNTYHDVDCGNGYDRGQTLAAELRASAGGSPSGGALRHQADVVEAVCDDWTGVSRYITVPVFLMAIGGFWLLFLRRRR